MPPRAPYARGDTRPQGRPKAVPNRALEGPGHDEHHVPDRSAGARRGERDTEALVAAAAAGEPQAWSELIDRYAVLIRSVCRAHRLCDADAEDVAQLTWLRAVEHIGRLRDPDRFGAWVGTTARRECLRGAARPQARRPDRGRGPQPAVRRARRRGRDRAAPPSAAPRCGSALGALPARQRTLLRLLHSERAPSYEAIGSALGMPVGSIGPTRGRALERLRKEIHHAPR